MHVSVEPWQASIAGPHLQTLLMASQYEPGILPSQLPAEPHLQNPVSFSHASLSTLHVTPLHLSTKIREKMFILSALENVYG